MSYFCGSLQNSNLTLKYSVACGFLHYFGQIVLFVLIHSKKKKPFVLERGQVKKKPQHRLFIRYLLHINTQVPESSTHERGRLQDPVTLN